jgi:predicted permease
VSWLHALRARLRLLFARRSAEQRFDHEIRFHVDMEAERLAREFALPPDEARRRALAAFGGVQSHREALRDGTGTMWISGWSLDFRLGLRMMAKYPGLTLVGVLGIAVAVAIGVIAFTAVETVTSTALPLDEGDRVVAIQNVDLRDNREGRRTHLHDLHVWREALDGVEDLGAYRTIDRNFVSPDIPPLTVRVAEITASGFRLARVAPVRGRYLLDEDERDGAPRVLVLGYSLWQQRLGGRADVIGSVVYLGDVAHTVIGVMPEGFAFPVNNQVWVPLRLNPLAYQRGDAPPVEVFGRLAPGATLADARLQLRTIGDRLSSTYPQSHEQIRPRIVPYTRAFLDGAGTPRLLHLGQLLVSLLLVVIGTNVAVLVYARAASREGELALRTALGASRRRIVAQLFAEALVLSAAASVVGVVVARSVFRVLEPLVRNSADEQIPYWMHLELSPPVILYVAGLTILAAVIIGVIPGLKATRHRISETLSGLSGGYAMQLGRGWKALLVAQVAVSVGLLPVALGGAEAWLRLALAEPGTRETRSVVMAMPLLGVDDRAPASRAVYDSARHASYIDLVDRLARRLEREARFDVIRMSSAPGEESTRPVEIEAGADATPADTIRNGVYARVDAVDSSFFEAFDVRLLAGRTFTAPDTAAGATAVVVNHSFARYFFDERNALGRRFRFRSPPRSDARDSDPGPRLEIVGVVRDFPALADPDALLPRVYLPLRPSEVDPLWLAVRAPSLTVAAAADRIRTIALGVDPSLRFRPIRAMDAMLADAVRVQRLALLGMVSVALSVLLLSAASIYALMSFTVARRRREIGIRCALGAPPGRVLTGVLSGAMRQVGLGILIGVIATGLLAIAARDYGSLLGGLTLAGQLVLTGFAMAVVGMMAAVGPARRALRVQPTEALKAE